MDKIRARDIVYGVIIYGRCIRRSRPDTLVTPWTGNGGRIVVFGANIYGRYIVRVGGGLVSRVWEGPWGWYCGEGW